MFLFHLLPSSRILTHLNIVQVTGKIAFLLYCFSDVFCNQKCSRYSTSIHGLGSYIRPCQPGTLVQPIKATSFKVKKLTANLFKSISFFLLAYDFTLLC